MIKRQKNIEFQRTRATIPLVATAFPRGAAYAPPYDIIQDAVDERVREMFCDVVAEPLPPEIHILLARLRGETRLN
ncbi:hypothetical protein [Azospirillum sp. B4]|uniref:hypothetical protein n=1 Tax=Azospirillum sp. B4 TaxID=95605 RepID=UPI00034CEB6D|nr:hypothetical protein [Azospirillum sp. B4]